MSETINVKRLNEVFDLIECGASVGQDLSDHFSFYAPNYQFMPLYKRGIWDGKVRLFNPNKGVMYGGLRPHLEKYCKTYNHKICVIPNTEYNEPVIPQPNQMMEYADAIPLTIGPKAATMKSYQREAVRTVLEKPKTLLLSPTSSGKSLIAYQICRVFKHFFPKKQCLIIVPTINLVQQLLSDFYDYSVGSKWPVDPNVHTIYSGQEKESTKCVQISTWQSLMNVPKSFFHKYDMVICDECHLATADSIKKILENSINAYFRVGMTGTIRDSVCHKLMLEGMLGPVFQVTTTKELIANKDVADISIDCIILKHPDDLCKLAKHATYQQEMDMVVGSVARNNFLINLVNSIEGNTLLLFQLVGKHGKVLKELLETQTKKPVFFIAGDVDGDEREAIRKIVDVHTNAVVVASYGTASTGISIRNLNNVIFGSPYKSKIRLLQSIGRGLRISDTKTKVKIFDISDDLSCGNYKNYGLKHLTERIKVYVHQEFPYKIAKVSL